MAGWIHPANPGLAERNTERTSRTGVALSPRWCASRRITGSTMGNPWGRGCRRAGDAQSGLVRHIWGAFSDTRAL